MNSNNNYNKNNNKNKNNADNNNKKRRAIRSRVSRTLVWQYFLALIIYTVLYVVLGLAGIQLAIKISWRTTPLYYIGIFVQEYFMASVVGFYAAGIVMLTYYFMSKPLKYLNDIIDATGQMLENKDEVIVLPKAMRNVEDELNMLRKQSIKNELIARAAEQRKNDLIVYLAHDLKTPLTSVIGYLNLLVDEPDISAATRARYTGIALEKAERLEELINDFFDITRFNLTTLTLDMENTNLSMMLEQIAFEFRPLLAQKELEIVTELESNVNIMCDRDKLERVFDNLLRNAINYSYNGTKIILSMKRDNDNVRIVVSNVGKTILPEKLARIFEQFYRVDSSRSTSTGGSGLGLAIAKEIVELHGGTIEVASADEKIVFTLTLPS